MSLPFPDAAFDAALTFHAGMNIADRRMKYREAARVIWPGGRFVVYDVLKGASRGMLFPVPLAEDAETSHLVSATAMRRLLAEAGVSLRGAEDRNSLVLTHRREKVAEAFDAGKPPPLGLHLLQGDTATEKSRNMIRMAEAGRIALALFFAELTG